MTAPLAVWMTLRRDALKYLLCCRYRGPFPTLWFDFNRSAASARFPARAAPQDADAVLWRIFCREVRAV